MSSGVTVHMIHGFVAAGKTTVATAIEAEFEAMRFSIDEWLINFYGTDAPVEMYLEFHERTATLIERQWIRAVELGIDVVLDFGFWTRAQRDRVRDTARALGVDTMLYFVDCPEEVALERCRRNCEGPDGSKFSIDQRAYRLLKERFEPLQADEPHVHRPS